MKHFEDLWDKLEEDDYADDYEPEWECVRCGEQNSIDQCCCCGNPLCHMHYELGAGFCLDCPTKEWIWEQEVMAPDETEI